MKVVGSSSKGTVVKKISMLNKNLVHLIDNVFWTMGFKTEKVVPITYNAPIIYIKNTFENNRQGDYSSIKCKSSTGILLI